MSNEAPKPEKIRIKKRHPLNITLAGIPELDFFESDEKREAALTQVARDVGRFGSNLWIAILASAVASISTMLLVAWLLQFVAWPYEIEHSVRIAVTILVTLFLIRRFHRRGFPAMLRKRLIEQGVPMCLKCGYNLRGQPNDSTRCLECGTAINEPSRKILGCSTPS